MQFTVIPESDIYNAVTVGRLDAVKVILERKPSKVNAIGPLGRTPLHKASQCGYLEIVRCLVNNGAEIQARDNEGKTPLHHAAERGREEVVEFLWNVLPVPNLVDSHGNTLLHAAACGGIASFVSKLISTNVDINITNSDGIPPLFVAASKGHAEIVNLLILNGARTGVRTTRKQTLLHAAAGGGIVTLVARMLGEEGIAGWSDVQGDTPLTLAARDGKFEVVQFLLETSYVASELKRQDFKVLLESACRFGWEPLFRKLLDSDGKTGPRRQSYLDQMLKMAAEKGHFEIARTLIQEGAKASSLTMNLDYFRHEQSSLKTVGLLIDSGVPLDRLDNFDMLPSEHAAYHGDRELLEILLARDGKLNGRVLSNAVNGQHLDLVQWIIEQGVSPNVRCYGGQTALIAATKGGHMAVCELLLRLGAKINLRDEEGNTALHYAVANESYPVVELLIHAGAKVSAVNKKGFQPIHFLPYGDGSDFVLGDEYPKFDRKVSEAILDLLLCNGASYDKYIAAGLGDMKFVQEHLRSELKSLSANFNGSGTMLHWATRGGHFEIVDMLITSEIDVNAVNSNGDSALHIACRLGRDAIVARLIQAGAEFLLRNGSNMTPLDIANKACFTDIVRILEASGATKQRTPIEQRSDLERELALQDLPVLASTVSNCRLCKDLAASRKNTVFGRGNQNASLVCIGSAPSKEDELAGIPFSGEVGQLLNNIVKACGLQDDVYIMNLICCAPENAAVPPYNYCYNCRVILDRHVTLIAPMVILCFGTFTATRLLGHEIPWTRDRKQTYSYLGRPVVVTHDLQSVLRSSFGQDERKKQVWDDCKQVLHLLGRPVPPHPK